MLQDLRDFPPGTRLDCDVAIVGAGAAGITLARHLAGRGRRIALVESGGLDFEADTQALAAGENRGADYYPLVDARLRFFGGTTAIWGGRCSRYDAIDFDTRSWVPESGWPISLAELEPYYATAAADFGLTPGAADTTAWNDGNATRFGFDEHLFTTRRWHFDDRAERFHGRQADDLFANDHVRVLLHANVTRVFASENARTVKGLELATLDGARRELCASHIVLAAGGIENARLLLASDDVEAAGLGNGHDQVGRYFMEHPHGRAGVLSADAGFDLWAAFQRYRLNDGARVAPVLLPAPGLQREAGILNTALTFKLQAHPLHTVALHKRVYNGLREQLAPTRTKRRLWHAYRDVRKFLQHTVRVPVQRRRFQRGGLRVNVMVRAEQAPNRDSRVTLSNERDVLGMRRAALEWRMSAIDKHTIAVLAAHLDGELERLGIGRLDPAEWLADAGTSWPVDPTVGNHPIGGYHHIGTTRMSASPRKGVVDGDCRVHGYANLFVAGSSVFATAGWANPTLTIVALAHRLGDELLEALR